MAKMRIIKKAFLGLDQEKLALYVQDLVPRFEAQPELAALQPQLAAVKAAAANYEAKLLEAVHGGRDRTASKKQALAVLLDRLDQLVGMVEAARLPVQVLVDAGFAVSGPIQRSTGGPIDAPEIRSVKALGDGAVEVKFRHPARKQVRMHLFEWSADQGGTWQSGASATRSPARLYGLPPLQKVQVRMCSFGTHGRRSVWSRPVEFGVL
jgi:hypothetical protein